MGQFGASVASYDKAVALKPDYLDAWVGRGLSYQALRQFDAAEKDFTEAIRIHPNEAGLYQLRGDLRSQKGDEAGALADRAKAKELAGRKP